MTEVTDEELLFPADALHAGAQDVLRVEVSRRQLLGGIAGSTALIYAGSASAATHSWYDIRFDLSQDERVLIVAEVRVDIETTQAKLDAPAQITTRRTDVCRWQVRANAFGPLAWFDMARPDGAADESRAPERFVIVRDAAFGGREKVAVGFRFTRAGTGADAGRWQIAYDTDLWLGSNGKVAEVASSPVVLFEAFLKGSPLVEIFASTRVDTTVDRIFAGRLRIRRGMRSNFRVCLTKDLSWIVQVNGEGGLAFLDDQVTIPELSFGWYSIASEPRPFFAAQAHLCLGSQVPTRLVVGDKAGHHIEAVAKLPDREGTFLFQARIGRSPLDPRVNQTVVGLRLGRADLSVRLKDEVLAGPVFAENLALSCTGLPGPNGTQRTVLWGDARGSEPKPAPTVQGGADSWAAIPEDRVEQREIRSPIGRLRVGPPPAEKDPADGKNAGKNAGDERGKASPQVKTEACRPGSTVTDAEQIDSRAAARILQIASGDKGGAREATVFAVHDSPSGLRRILIDLSLYEASAAVPDVSYSRLTFTGSELRLAYDDGRPLAEIPAGEYPHSRAASFVWVGPPPENGTQRALLQLSRAHLVCARDYDLVKLRFRFHELALSFTPAPAIRPVHEDCSVLERDGGLIEDSRPILVAEFDPQHVMEQAIFRPEPPPLPDVELKTSLSHDGTTVDPSREAIVAYLDSLGSPEKREEFRKLVAAEKSALLSAFKSFAEQYRKAAAKLRSLPRDQRVYIGPFALDPDAAALARLVHQQSGQNRIQSALVEMRGRIEAHRQKLHAAGKLAPITPDDKRPVPVAQRDDVHFRNALRNEVLLEQQEPLYAVYRGFWRDQSVAARSRNGKPSQDAGRRFKFAYGATTDYRLDEYLTARNRPSGVVYGEDQEREIERAFIEFALGLEPIPDLVEGRLSGPSRLAFRLNCRPLAGLDAEEAGVLPHHGDGPTRPGPAGVSYEPIPFTFEALTDWSRHEPAVTRRARKLFTALPSGLLPPLGNRAANVDDPANLRFQGISAGPTTAAQRMTEIRSSLMTGPTELETAIEIPSRLILSPAQDAVWRTNRRLPREVLEGKVDDPIGSLPPKPPLEHGQAVAPKGPPQESRGTHIWAARLVVADVPPDLRVIASPDLRPMALQVRGLDGVPRLPGHGAPPRGPFAPWFIGLEQSESGTLGAGDIKPVGAAQNDDACKEQQPEMRSRLVRWLCERFASRAGVPADDYGIFRTSLDANDRHQLVLLSSAYGLPVTGKRQATGDDVEVSGSLVTESGQIEPGDDFSLLDARNDQAIYRPVPLKVSELSLTALGGSFLHDTAFKPAAGADDIWGRKIFEGFAIERWQHDIVLGRDVRAEVVYKGYLFPLGHRASLIKLTERVFLRTPAQGIKAMLRQRLYLRIAEPAKLFPAVGQPHAGRMWCGRIITLLTTQTPDLIDPSLPVGPQDGGESLNGRIDLGDDPGLAFWPRTDITPQGLLRFEIDIDGAKTALPLIFLDNIAATNAPSLKQVSDYYNGRPEELRWAALGGQNIRYAPERKPGDATLATEALVIRSQGRPGTSRTTWVGDVANFQTTGVLEGAEQPPFYPALDFARVRLEQIERFTGGKPLPVEVQYDGHYVRYGFKADRRTEALVPERDNPLDVFMNLRRVVKLDMGGNGDRAAAVARPNSFVIALSPTKGPLGGDGTVWWQTGPTGDSLLTEAVARDGAELTHVVANDADLVSLAAYFNGRSKPPASAEAGTVQLGESKAQAVQAAAADSSDETKRQLQLVQSYFSGDAKLLGTITLKQLMTLLDIKPENLPVLREVIDYGTAAQKAGTDLATDVKTRVLSPLRGVIGRMLEQWNQLDDDLRRRQGQLPGGAGASPLSLASIYPEIDTGLALVDDSLTKAIATEDPVALTSRLAEIYEAARRLIHGLEAVAANPVERLQDAIGADIRRRIALVTDSLGELAVLAKKLETVLAFVRNPDPDRIASWIISNVIPPAAGGDTTRAEPDLAEQLSLAIVPVDLIAVARSVLGNAVDEIRKELEEIARNFAHETAFSSRELLRTLLKELVARVLSGDTNLQPVIRHALQEYVRASQERIQNAIKAAEEEIGKIDETARPRVAAAKAALEAELRSYRAYITAELIDRLGDLTAQTLPMELASLLRAVDRGIRIFEQAKRIAEADKPEALLSAASDFTQDVLGLDVAAVSDTFKSRMAAVGESANTQIERAVEAVGIKGIDPEPGLFAKELRSCALFRADPTKNAAVLPVTDDSGKVAGSIAPLTQLAPAIQNLTALVEKNREIAAFLENNRVRLRDALEPKTYDDVVACNADVGLLLSGAGASPGLVADSKRLYCVHVDMIAGLRAVRAQAVGSETDPGRAVVERWARAGRQLRTSGVELGDALASMARQMSTFVERHKMIVGIGAVVAGAAAFSANFPVGETLKKRLDELSTEAKALEKPVAEALKTVVNIAIGLLIEGAMLSSTLARDAKTAVDSAAAALRGIMPDSQRDPVHELVRLSSALADVVAHLTGLAGVKPITDPVETLAALREKRVNGVTVEAFFLRVGNSSPFIAVAAALRDAESRIVSEWRAFQQRINGLPGELRSKLETAILTSGVIAGISGAYEKILAVRNEALTQVDRVPALRAAARRALLVEVPGGSCNIADTAATVADLIACDGLTAEARFLRDLKATAGPLTEPVRTQLKSFLIGWRTETAGPLVIIRKSGEIVTDVLRGDVLAVIDLGAFRDQIEDVIADLIPTRATLSYDFRSLFSNASARDAIFQPKQGETFSLEVRSTVNLLAPEKAEFRARGSMGAFDIKLVGGVVDALTLKFGGATFELAAGAKPRFDVAYTDFVIGEDLKFAQELQAYLVPEEGSGVFVQPLGGRPGIEAGYGLNLGTLNVGNTSFFNVTLNVSAELPFDSSESLFKVSLGRRLAPFTMSVLPFAGSGYFSIFAAADGIRGFEASFEFGGGGALRFGPLNAQARIQVGVFVRVLRVNEVNVTTIYGTFFAGGSASIWIFHFATSLYVRLGRSDGGAMYGEAVYTFSFSLGLADYDYSVTAYRNEPAIGSGSGGNQNGGFLDESPGPRIQYAALSGETATDASGAARAGVSSSARGSRDWNAFIDHFDSSLLPACEIP